MKLRPAAFIIENDKILLMNYEYGGQLVYNLPGGNLDAGETLAEALKRELEEELGVNIIVGHLILVGEMSSFSNNEAVLHCIFKCEIIKNRPVINPNETSAIGISWRPINDISALNLYPNIGKELCHNLSSLYPNPYIGRFIQPWF